jgi:hypothetical protein
MRPIRSLVAAPVLGVALALALTAIPGAASPAIPTPQYACTVAGPGTGIGSASGYVLLARVSVALSEPRNVIATLSADANVTLNAEMRSTFTLDGAAPTDYKYGPGNLAENQQFEGTRTTMSVIPQVPAGIHTIAAWARVNGSPTSSGHVARRCMTAEAQTA